MPTIELKNKDHSLHLHAFLNGLLQISFKLDTGHETSNLSKEMAELLAFAGGLDQDDVIGETQMFMGGHSSAVLRTVNMKSISCGSCTVKNVQMNISDRYGCSDLLGMSFLEKIGNFAITRDFIEVDDSAPDVVIAEMPHVEHKGYKAKSLLLANLLIMKTERAKHQEKHYIFDYADWYEFFHTIIGQCVALCKENKYQEAIRALEEFRSIIKDNLADDMKHPTRAGSFFTGRFFYTLGEAYYQSGKYAEVTECSQNCMLFYQEGSQTWDYLNDRIAELSE